MTYPQFAQMLRGLQGERIRQAFHYLDTNGDGYIEPEDFSRIIRETAGHKLSDHLLENLATLCNISPGSQISYANVRAFQNIIREMDLVELVIRNAVQKSDDGKITRTDFLNEAARITRFSLFTPMEADILFHFASLDQPSGRLSLGDFARVLDASWIAAHDPFPMTGAASDMAAVAVAKSKSFFHDILVSAHHFALGSIAGAFGAFMVYPIDLVKTRMQNQRNSRVGQALYKNSFDCFSKVVRNEGVRGLYSGVLPQLVGVAPEKAIKLTVNDLVRGKFSDPKTGAIWWPWEILAGGSAGACQVIFTNPLEIVKIRLQVQGEIAKTSGVEKRSAMWIVRHLGLVGLYKGASACLLRDVPFSAIYFPTYNHLKRDYFGEGPNKKLGKKTLNQVRCLKTNCTQASFNSSPQVPLLVCQPHTSPPPSTSSRRACKSKPARVTPLTPLCATAQRLSGEKKVSAPSSRVVQPVSCVLRHSSVSPLPATKSCKVCCHSLVRARSSAHAGASNRPRAFRRPRRHSRTCGAGTRSRSSRIWIWVSAGLRRQLDSQACRDSASNRRATKGLLCRRGHETYPRRVAGCLESRWMYGFHVGIRALFLSDGGVLA